MDDTEVEEGEACYYKDDTSIDPDIALSYIDEKLQSVLGHFQKDFEGGVSAENLGAKFGGYGSFLPSYQRSPSIRSHPKNLKEVQSFSLPESPNVLPVEGAAQYSTVPSDAVQSSRLGTAPRSLPSLHSAMTPSGDFSAKKDSCLSSAQGKKLPIKDEPVSNKQVSSSDQRTLKVRIKMNSDTIAKDKAAIYSGLGLTSSSSSMGNSPEDSSGMPSQCPGTLRESLSNILKIMTSFPVPGGSLLSPLTESLICLEMKEKLPRNISPVKTINKVSKERKKKVVEKRDNLVISKGEICMNLGDRRTNHLKQEVDVEVGNMGSETLVHRSCIFSDKNPRPVSSTACSIVDSMKDADMAPQVPEEAERSMSVKKTEVIKNTMEDILSLGFVEEESLESISGQNGGNFERRDFRSSSIENISESQSRNSCRDDSTDRRGDARSKRNNNSTLFKADSDVSNCSRDPFGQTAMNHENGEVKMPHGAGKSSLWGKKKSKRSQNSGNLASEAEGCLMSESYEVPKEKKRSGKMRNLQPQTTGEHMINQIGYLLERPSGIRANNSNQGFFEMKQGASLNKSKELSTHKGIDAQLTSGSFSKEAANSGHPSLQVGVISVMEPTPAAPIVIEEDWVCCDRCQKWRLLPYGTKPDQLPEKWMCSMLNWLPGMNRCDISEDDTTQALHALYQPVLPKSQSNLKNHVDRTVPGASSADGSYLGQNHQNLGSHCMPNPQKKKQKSKETHWAVSNGSSVQISGSVKKFQPDVVKSRSLNDMTQPCSGSNLMSNSHIQPLSKPHKFPVGKNTHIQKEKQVNHVAGDPMEKALKSKRPADQYECGTTKRIRVDVASGADKCLSTGKVPISAKKEGESLETGSSEMKTYGEKEISLKKRKLKDWQESQNYIDASKNNGNHLPESKAFVKEESSDSEFRKVKKSAMSNREGRQAIFSKGDERLNSEGKVTKLKNPVYGREEFNIEKDHKARKHKTKGSAYDDMDILKRDLGSDQFSRAATSSSSKVSDSRKSRSQFLEVKGSPVESVSSSPIRTSNLDKLSPARKDNLRKNTLKNGDILMMHFPKKSLDREGNVESNLAGTARRGKASAVSHPKSLGFSVLDFRDENDGKKFGGKSRLRVKSPDRYRGVHLVKNEADTFDGPCPGDLQFSDHCHSEDKRSKNLNHDNALFQEKSRSSSLLSRCKDGSSGNNTERIKVKLSDRSSGMLALNLKENMKDELKNGPNHVALLRGESSDLKCRIKLVKNDSDTKSTRITPQLQQIQVVDDKVPKKSDLIRIGSRVGNSSQVISSDAVNKDPSAHLPPSIPPSQQGSALNVVPVDYSCNGDSSKVLKQSKDAPCPLRKDDSSQVASTALKEAEKFKGYADRLKDSGFGFECNEAYFQAALKFLHGASLLETCNYDGSKRGGMSQMQIYSNAAKLFELCAQEYEKCHDMAAAALTYKCVEVAYMRVVYCKNSSMNRDRQDLQASLQMVPQGESPSSSASDVDSLNNQVMVDNAALSKGNSSHGGKHTIAARNRPNFIRLLDFTKDVNSAMEASYKSQNAFAAANVILEEAQNKEGIISVKRVIDLSFQDVEELLRLVRLAIDSTSRQGFGGNKD